LDPSPINVSGDPEQRDIKDPQPFTVNRGGYSFRLYPLASYVLRGIALGRKNYSGDASAALAPYDVAVAWGQMAKDGLCTQLSWSQSGRWYWWKFSPGFGHDNAFVARYTSNTHVIPATGFLKSALRSIRRADLVEMNGDLVRVEGLGSLSKFRWVSSLSRSDREAGSCELLYLRWLKVGAKVYR
jgi:hypothetical protein